MLKQSFRITLYLQLFLPYQQLYNLYFILTTAHIDYESKMHTVPIPFNTMIFNYTVMINDDDLYEENEMFMLEIKNSSHDQVKIGEQASTTVTVTSEEQRELFV